MTLALNTVASMTTLGSAKRENERTERSTRYLQGSLSQVSLHESVSSAKEERKVAEAQTHELLSNSKQYILNLSKNDLVRKLPLNNVKI